VSAVYVYGVTRGDAVNGHKLAGVSEQAAPVRVVTGGGLTAAVSDVPADWRAAQRADVETHDRILAELMTHATVVPMRFGVVMDDDAQVRELLERHAGELDPLLNRLEGHVQMTVKAYYGEDALLRETLRHRPELTQRPADSPQQRIELGREVAAAVEEQREHDRRALLEPLAAAADEVRVEDAVTERQALVAHLLVAQERRAKLDAAVERLVTAIAPRLTLRYIGPLPPYSFSDLALTPWD